MSSPARSQVQQRPANGAPSNGPVTAKEQAAILANAIQQGLRAEVSILPTEKMEDFDLLHKTHKEVFRPQSYLAMRLVREVSEAEWRIRRIRRMMDETFRVTLVSIQEEYPDLPAASLEAMAFNKLHAKGSTYSQYLKYEAKYERQFNQAVAELKAIEKDRLKAENQHLREEVDYLQKIALEPPPLVIPEKRTNKPEATPRNAPCPCGSGEKYKRCCGKNAPPQLC